MSIFIVTIYIKNIDKGIRNLSTHLIDLIENKNVSNVCYFLSISDLCVYLILHVHDGELVVH